MNIRFHPSHMLIREKTMLLALHAVLISGWSPRRWLFARSRVMPGNRPAKSAKQPGHLCSPNQMPGYEASLHLAVAARHGLLYPCAVLIYACLCCAVAHGLLAPIQVMIEGFDPGV